MFTQVADIISKGRTTLSKGFLLSRKGNFIPFEFLKEKWAPFEERRDPGIRKV